MDDLDGPLPGYTTLDSSNEDDLHRLVGDLSEILDCDHHTADEYHDKMDKVLELNANAQSELKKEDQAEKSTALQDEITLLKREKEELEEKLAGLRMQGMSGIEDLAHGSDIFELRYRSTDEFQNREHEGTEEISWNDLLKIIGPRMMAYIKPRTMKEIIESHLKNKLWSEPHLMEIKIYGPFIDDNDFETIKIQLRELGLIERHPSADHWKLTEYGDRQLAKLMSIRKEEK